MVNSLFVLVVPVMDAQPLPLTMPKMQVSITV